MDNFIRSDISCLVHFVVLAHWNPLSRKVIISDVLLDFGFIDIRFRVEALKLHEKPKVCFMFVFDS